MEQKKLTEGMLQQAFLSLSDEMIEEWEEKGKVRHKFSEQFQNKMEKLIKKTVRKEKMSKFSLSVRYLSAMAAVALICVIVFTTGSMKAWANPMHRFKKMETALETSAILLYEKNLAEGDAYMYGPGHIPKGYEEIYRGIEGNRFLIYYENEQGNSIKWFQMSVTDTLTMGINTECEDIYEGECKGEPYKIYILESGKKLLYFESGDYVFMASADDLSAKELGKMLEGMKICQENR